MKKKEQNISNMPRSSKVSASCKVVLVLLMGCLPIKVFADPDWPFKGDDAKGILQDYMAGYKNIPPQRKLIRVYGRLTVKEYADGDPKLKEIQKRFGDDLEQINTSAGLLTAITFNPIDGRLYLKDQEIAAGSEVRLLQACPEKEGLPSIVLVHIYPDNEYDPDKYYQWPHVVDLAVSPPYISKDYMPLLTGAGGGRPFHVRHHPLIKKGPRPDTYLITGDSFKEHDKKGNPLFVTYIYDRKAGTLGKLK